MKRYALYYTSDRRAPRSNIGDYLHFGGYASSVKTIKQYVSRVKKEFAAENPRDFFYTDWEYYVPLAPENRVYL